MSTIQLCDTSHHGLASFSWDFSWSYVQGINLSTESLKKDSPEGQLTETDHSQRQSTKTIQRHSKRSPENSLICPHTANKYEKIKRCKTFSMPSLGDGATACKKWALCYQTDQMYHLTSHLTSDYSRLMPTNSIINYKIHIISPFFRLPIYFQFKLMPIHSFKNK